MTKFEEFRAKLGALGIGCSSPTSPEERRAHQLWLEEYTETRQRVLRRHQIERTQAALRDLQVRNHAHQTSDDEPAAEHVVPADPGWGE